MRALRVLVLMHESLVPPESMDGYSETEIAEWKTEFDVVTVLRGMGHEVRPLGVYGDLMVIRQAIDEWKPHITFNLLEEFHGISFYDQHVVSYLELLRQPFTGCNPRGLTLTRDKALSKKILAYHRIRVPRFAVFPRARKIRAPTRLRYPLFVKSLAEEGSYGISQASIVRSPEKLVERVEFLHEKKETHAIAEEYIDGREMYVAVIGNERVTALPVIELVFKNKDDDTPTIATRKAKWDWKYQKKHGVDTIPVKDLPPAVEKRMARIARRVYRTLHLSGYARVDLRMTADHELFVLEANPNPDISYGAEFSCAAEEAGIEYPALLQKIINLGLRYSRQWRENAARGSGAGTAAGP